jgi:hypothetical protein
MLVNCPTQAKTGLEWGTRLGPNSPQVATLPESDTSDPISLGPLYPDPSAPTHSAPKGHQASNPAAYRPVTSERHWWEASAIHLDWLEQVGPRPDFAPTHSAARRTLTFLHRRPRVS